MNMNLALRMATEAYSRALPPGILPMYSELEWWWLTSLAVSAENFWRRMLEGHRLSLHFKELLVEGIAWRVRTEMPHYREASLTLVKELGYTLPSIESLKEAKKTADGWEDWMRENLYKLVCAIYKGDQAASQHFQIISSPRYIQLHTGWMNIQELEIKIRESFRAPGPKSHDLVSKNKSIIRAFPPIYEIDGRRIDLGALARRFLETTTRWLPLELE